MKKTLPQNYLIMSRRVLRLLQNFLSGFFIICLAIHFFIKDETSLLSILYYSTPLPILAIFSFAPLSQTLHVVDCRLHGSRFSDHRSVVANIALTKT